jgi:hypothetical protein
VSGNSYPVGHVVFQAKVGGVTDSFTPLDFELRQGWGQQDVLFGRTVVAKGRSASPLTTWTEGSPVEIAWGRPPQALQSWYGYLNHAEKATDDDATGQNVQLTYVLAGTSKAMLGDTNRSWEGYTISAIAQRIAREYCMRCVVTTSPWVLPYEVQANESDWSFLNRMASKTGMRVWVSGGTLYCIDPAAVLSGASNFTVPVYLINKASGWQDSARNFKVVSGNALPGAYKMNHLMHGIDSAGNAYAIRQDGADPSLPDVIQSGWHAASTAQARSLMNAEAALAQYWQVATVEVMGYNLVYPGKVVGFQGNAISDGDSGNWIVAAATHVARQSGSGDPAADHYVSRLTVLRNAKGYPLVKGVHKIAPEVMPCVLQGNAWRATSIGTVIEGAL